MYKNTNSALLRCIYMINQKAFSRQDGVCNTRLNSQDSGALSQSEVRGLSIHCDYLRVKVVVNDVDNGLISFLKFIHHDLSEWIINYDVPYRNGHIWYDHCIDSSIGVHGGFKILHDENDDMVGVECVLDIGGLYFMNVDVVDQWRLIKGLEHTYNAVCQRNDIAIDDDSNGGIIPIKDMEREAHNKNIALFRKGRKFSSGQYGMKDWLTTIEFGSRESGKMVRVYEKIVHGCNDSVHGCNQQPKKILRFETEFKRKYAQLIFKAVASLERPYVDGSTTEKVDDNTFSIEISKVLGSLAVGAIDFVQRYDSEGKYNKDYGRCKRLQFWQDFIDKVGTFLRIQLPKIGRTTEKTIAWITRQVAGLLNAIKDGVGSAKLWEFLMDAMNERCKYKGSYHELVTGTLKSHPELLRVRYNA